MLVALIAHAAAALALPPLAARLGRGVFAVAAAIPAATFLFAAAATGRVIGGDEPVETVRWAPLLGLELVFRLDELALVMALLVSGVGAVVLLYFAGYAAYEKEGIGRNCALMLAFAGAMLGLVLSDNVLGLYVFWELTTLCSFGLIGGVGLASAQRRAALQSMLTTTVGGLAMLLGLLLLADAAGTTRISGILAAAPGGAVVDTALVLIAIGALTKSAQLPFHPWLPAAMVAPTPVSAYLHAAAMVKAGVYLVARLAPGFSGHAPFVAMVTVAGLASLLVGAYRAVRQTDLKALLAYATVSQLGLLLVLFAAGTPAATAAGVVMLLAHGLFKAPLFLVAGIAEKVTGSRDLRELSGLGRRWPLVAGTTVVASASMIGLPPWLGFAGKETAFDAFLTGEPADTLVLACLVAGTVLTVAYSARLLRGLLATEDGVWPPQERPMRGFTAPAAALAVAGLALGPAVSELRPLAGGYELALWHGFGPPLALSAVTLAAGYGVYRVRDPGWHAPPWLDAQHWYERAVHGVDAGARAVTGRTQVGSLPVYLGVILLSVAALPAATALLAGAGPGAPRAWDTWLQVPLAIVAATAALGMVMVRRRITAVLLMGGAGYAIGALFLVHGAPDLALTQVLVESLTLIVFVFVLWRLPAVFTRGRGGHSHRWLKATIAGFGGGVLAMAAWTLSGMRTAESTAREQYLQRAKPDAGATNVVNAILVDFRALDTVGEVTVLVVAITGAAGLIFAARRSVGRIERERGRNGQEADHDPA